jgi:histidyl-tRNA synthetase
VLEINSLGDPESRAAHRKVLIDFFKAHESKLSEDSRSRLERNPLRIFDSKDEGDRALLPDAPLLKEYLTPAARDFFAAVLRGLDDIGIAYRVNPHLVRGLDYYTHSAFEFVTTRLGAQGTVLAGGRYDGLIQELGGPPTPGIGWAAGIERLMMLANEPAPSPRPVALVPLGEAAERKALVLARDLRRRGVPVELDYTGNMKRRLQRANKVNARAAVILGDNELAKGVAALKDLDKGEQKEVPLGQLAEMLAS